MRVPLSKIYRAFPELDQFSDEECERYIRGVNRHGRLQTGCLPAAMFIVIAIVGVCLAIAFEARLDRAFPLPAAIEWGRLGAVISYVVALVGAVVLRDHMFQRVIARRLALTRCPKCGYSLLGLPVANDTTTCPECGAHIILADYHLTPEDLLAQPAISASANHQEGPA